MRQILQNLGTGETLLAEVPEPAVQAGHLLIQTAASLVSIGTERMLVDFGRSGWIDKARKQPDKVRQVLEKIKTDGLMPTIEAVRNKLDQPLAPGYCNAGRVLAVGSGTTEFSVGDRVISNGPHAEFVLVPKNLCARIPEGVDDASAAFTVLGSIGLQGVRLVNPQIGETVVVTGLGLIGLLAVQILLANGCRVIGTDFDSSKCALAQQLGAETVDLSKGEDPVAAANVFTGGAGVDAVLITASTSSNDPVHQAALMCRKRGRIVLVGVVGLQLSRADFYEKELSFQVSCSYGPGRYDESYERGGHDYPYGLVRWTEQRNFGAVLNLLAAGKIKTEPLITQRIPFKEALRAYGDETLRRSLGIILEYPNEQPVATPVRTIRLTSPYFTPGSKSIVGVLGAGNFTGGVILPALKETGARLKRICSSTGVSATHLGKKFGFEESSTDSNLLFDDPEINTLFITTRHSSHARYVIRGLQAGKNVFVEKPLCVTREELISVQQVCRELSSKGKGGRLMIGFNRRFAPHVHKMRQLLGAMTEPKAITITVNAGAIPMNHWTQNPAEGGRIIGEGCHFIDLALYLAGSAVISCESTFIGPDGSLANQDICAMTLKFKNGSIASISYFANGHKSVPKERIEVFCGGRVLRLNNFRSLEAAGWKKFKKMKLWSQDKGHKAEVQTFIKTITEGGPSPIPFEEIVNVTEASFAAAKI